MDYWRKGIHMRRTHETFEASTWIRKSGQQFKISPVGAVAGLMLIAFIANAIWSMVS